MRADSDSPDTGPDAALGRHARAQIAFHLTGARAPGTGDGHVGSGLRPALLADYRDLAKLRHDFPLVLVEGDGAPVRSLSALIDGVLQEIAPRGLAGEKPRKHVLRLEAKIRERVLTKRATGTLTELWARAAKTFTEESERDSLARAESALGNVDGAVIGCDAKAPLALVTHLWNRVQGDKARRLRDRLAELGARLAEILKADELKSGRARAPDALKGSVGTGFEAAFDFDVLSNILVAAAPKDRLTKKRGARIREALAVIGGQRFVPRRVNGTEGGGDTHAFVFDSAARALAAHDERLAELVALVKSIAIAELEIANQYREAVHDRFFASFDHDALTPEDLALFPSYLVCLGPRRHEPEERAGLIEAMSSSLDVKILVQSDDILGADPLDARLAGMIVGLNTAYVLQTTGSNLYQARERIARGLSAPGPALFSIFSGACEHAAGHAPYLVAAAALQSRAFPSFTHDPGAGGDWASRFDVGDNPEPGADWPARNFAYEDRDLQRASETIAFTYVDFAACDRRQAKYFARVPRSQWHDSMLPAAAYMALGREEAAEKVPYVLLVDGDGGLARYIVEDRLIAAARRCVEAWHSLRELGGIENSHAKRLLEAEREAWEREVAEAGPSAEAEPPQEEPEPDAAAPEEALAPAPAPGDETYIETARCTSCDECTQINDRMFAYDDNKQAYIADIDAGTYRQLVEAAEACQVAIIHLGPPRNPDEPGLDELVERAKFFA